MTAPVVRYPFAPLEALLGDVDLARVLGVSGRTIGIYKHRGLSDEQADKAAVRAGFVAYEVWPELLDDLIDGHERACGNRLCDERFVPLRSNHVYCSPRCRTNTQARRVKRRRYARDPEFAERLRAKRRESYAECQEYERARQSRYDAAKREERART